RFQPIHVNEPSPEHTLEILKGLRDRYEAHHRVQITDGALKTATELSNRYITGRVLPDKAIDVIDEAGARIRLRSMTTPPEPADGLVHLPRPVRRRQNAAGQEFGRVHVRR